MKSTIVLFSAAPRGLAALAALALSVTAMGQVPNPLFPLPAPAVSTVPSNGDVNPYGVAFVPHGVALGGSINPGDILVSNFNNNQNLQGTGTTIVKVAENGQPSLFYQGPQGLGLTAALGVVKAGWVFVGNTPTLDGTSATVMPGSLLVLSRSGALLGAIADTKIINGPWGMAIQDNGTSAHVFISNVLDGTVTRLDLTMTQQNVVVTNSLHICTGFAHRTDPAALVLGPSGLYYDATHDILYVANSDDNTIYSINNAAARTTDNGISGTVYQDNVHLHGPLMLASALNGHLLVANSDGSNADPNQPSEIVEFTLGGAFVSQYSIDGNNGGAFGVATTTIGATGGAPAAGFRFAAVDDNANVLKMWTVPIN